MHGGLKDTLRVLRRKEVWTAYLRPPVHRWELDSPGPLPLGHNHSDRLDKMPFKTSLGVHGHDKGCSRAYRALYALGQTQHTHALHLHAPLQCVCVIRVIFRAFLGILSRTTTPSMLWPHSSHKPP